MVEMLQLKILATLAEQATVLVDGMLTVIFQFASIMEQYILNFPNTEILTFYSTPLTNKQRKQQQNHCGILFSPDQHCSGILLVVTLVNT